MKSKGMNPMKSNPGNPRAGQAKVRKRPDNRERRIKWNFFIFELSLLSAKPRQM